MHVTTSGAPEVRLPSIETEEPGNRSRRRPRSSLDRVANDVAAIEGAFDRGGRVTTSLVAQPLDLAGALEALAAGARPVAGGTDLVVSARQGKCRLPDALVAIHRIEALRGISGGEALELGPLATHEEIAAHPVVRARFTALADASSIVGSHATRANGTIGGILMNASPAMETGGPLICLSAVATLARARFPWRRCSHVPARRLRGETSC